jgi:glycosyltransferase involved in cell wall biosynthesis
VRISIITPVLNKAAYVERCFDSVAEQSCADVEHIVVDGGSDDGTVNLIEKYACRREGVTWISKPDQGQSDAMNRGIRMARGDVIGFLNADDYYESDVLTTVSDLFQELRPPAILFGNCIAWNESGEIRFVNKPEVLDLVEWLLPEGDRFIPVNPVQYFYTSDLHPLIGNFDENEHYVMDMDFLFRAVQVANCRYIDRLFGHFRLIPGTKTLADIQAATADARFLCLKRKYVKSLPFRTRLVYEMKRIARRVGSHRSDRPSGSS